MRARRTGSDGAWGFAQPYCVWRKIVNAPNLFEYPPEVSDSGAYVKGFEVSAVDGTIGTVSAATYDHGKSCLVVDTDARIGGQRRLLPAGTVRGVSREARRLFIGLTKAEVWRGPDYDQEEHRADERHYLEEIARYYEPWAPLRRHVRTP